jgi:hypothetical protein
MTKLHVEYTSHESGGQPLSDDKWTDYSDRIITFSLTNVFLNREDKTQWRNEDIESDVDIKRGDTVFVVVVRYGDGDTFSRSRGNYSFWGAYKDFEKPYELKRLIYADDKHHNLFENKPSYGNKKSVNKWNKESKCFKKQITDLATIDYVCLYNWRGYFNSLESVEIHVMTVL